MNIPFARGSDTSEQAAESVRHSGTTDEFKVLKVIRESTIGLTDEEVELILGLRHQTASARRKGLVDAGKVKDSGHRRRTRTGRFAVVWVAGYDPDPIRGAKAARGTPRPSASVIGAAVDAIESVWIVAPAMRQPALDEVVRWLRDVLAREGAGDPMTDVVHIKPGDEARGCEIHEWPTEGLAKRLLDNNKMRVTSRPGQNTEARVYVDEASGYDADVFPGVHK